MGVLLDETFDDGTDGTVANETNTDYSRVAGGADAFFDDAVGEGGMSCLLPAASGSPFFFLDYPAAKTLTRERIVFQLGGRPTGNRVMWELRSPAPTEAVVCQLQVTAGDGTTPGTGGIRIRNGFSAVATIADGIPAGELIRAEVRIDASGSSGTHSIECQLFWGADLDNAWDSYSDQLLATGLTLNGSSWDESKLGKISTDPSDWWIDSHKIVDDDNPIGPVTPASTQATKQIRNAASDGWVEGVRWVRNAANDGWVAVMD